MVEPDEGRTATDELPVPEIQRAFLDDAAAGDGVSPAARTTAVADPPHRTATNGDVTRGSSTTHASRRHAPSTAQVALVVVGVVALGNLGVLLTVDAELRAAADGAGEVGRVLEWQARTVRLFLPALTVLLAGVLGLAIHRCVGLLRRGDAPSVIALLGMPLGLWALVIPTVALVALLVVAPVPATLAEAEHLNRTCYVVVGLATAACFVAPAALRRRRSTDA